MQRVESDLSDTEDEDFVNETHAVSISELIHCVQNEAKKLRHGIAYTKMLESTLGCFKSPKVWSTIRMVVYEFEMLERFL